MEEASFLRLACGGAGDARPTSRSGRRRLHGGLGRGVGGVGWCCWIARRGVCAPPRVPRLFCHPAPPRLLNVCPHPASAHLNTSRSYVLNLGMGIQRPGGSSPCLRIAYSLWSGWKQIFLTSCTERRSCTRALC